LIKVLSNRVRPGGALSSIHRRCRLTYPLAALGPLNNRFREIVDRPEVEKEVLLPLTTASWDLDGTSKLADLGGRLRRFFSMGFWSNYPSRHADDLHFTLGKTDRSLSIPTVVGARMQERNPNEGKFGFRGRSVQMDLRRLVESVMEIRRHQGFEGVVISPETVKGRDPGLPYCRRVRFGLRLPADERFKGDVEGAKECHDRIMEAIFESGFKLEPPSPPFDPKTGMKGLAEWADNVRLIRGMRIRPWWFLPLFLLFCCFPWSCQSMPKFWSSAPPVAYVLLVDNSSSMKKDAKKQHEQVKRFLDVKMKMGVPLYANIIFFNDKADPVFDRIELITPDKRKALDDALGKMKYDVEETNMSKGLNEAVKEMKAFGRPVPVKHFTDAIDMSVGMVGEKMPTYWAHAGGPFPITTVTPRQMDPLSDRAPVGPHEEACAKMNQTTGSTFGDIDQVLDSPAPNPTKTAQPLPPLPDIKVLKDPTLKVEKNAN
jgi:hypothetical protein